MRELDRNSVYFDKQGKPLKGRVYFYVKGSTTIQNIYQSNGTTLLPNPMFTTNGRLAPQVFLQDKDYSIVWESYVSDGNMQTDLESTHWKQVGSAISLQPSVTINIPSKGLVYAENITALRAINPSTISEGVVTLLGFSSAGDKPAINYKWNSSSTASDNGTSVIKPTIVGTGAFELINDGDIDCRHLGVFPADTAATTSNEQGLLIASAHAYAVSKNINVYFRGNNNQVGFYRLLSGNYTRFYCADNNARFVALDNVEVDLNQVESRLLYVATPDGFGAKFTLKGSALHSSFNVSNDTALKWKPTEKFYVDVVDQSGSPSSFDGTECIPFFIESASKTYTFKNLNEIQGKKLTDNAYIFISCTFTDKFFANNSVNFLRVSLTNCSVDIDNFYSVENWINAVKKSGGKVFDFGGKSVSENVSFSDLTSVGYEIINGTFAGEFSYNGLLKLVKFNNCVFSDFKSNNTQNKLEFIDCVVSSESNTIKAYSINAHNTKFDTLIGTNASYVYLTAESCEFGKNIYTVNADLNCCKIGAILNSYAVDEIVKFSIKNCTFFDVGSSIGYHKLNGSSSVVKGCWIGNTFNGTKYIDGNVGNSASHDSVYESNSGNCFKNERILQDYTASVVKDEYDVSYAGTKETAGIGVAADISSKFFGYGGKNVCVTFVVRVKGKMSYEYYTSATAHETRTREVSKSFTFNTYKFVYGSGETEHTIQARIPVYDIELGKLTELSAEIGSITQTVI